MNKCLGCMYEYSEQYKVCPKCGYILNSPAQYAYHITPGSILHGRYLAGKAIGDGGFGITYVGWDMTLEHKIAIKEYFPREFASRVSGQTHISIFSDERGLQFQLGKERFIEEAQRLAKYNQQKGIVHVYDYFEENDTAYIIMEYISGETYKERLERKGKIPLNEALDVTIQVLQTLEIIHADNLIHRDIAPDNIRLTDTGDVVLLDFGASRFATTQQSKSLSVILKSGFAPEEQYLSHGNQGPWTDVYAVAATFYKLITGVTPQPSIERHANDQVKKPSKLGVSIPRSTENAIMNAMNVQIEDRTQSARDFLNALHADKVKRKKEKALFTDIGKWPLWTKIVIPLMAVFIGTFLGLMRTGVIHFDVQDTKKVVLEEGKTIVPDIVNMSLDEAQTIADASHLKINVVKKEYSDTLTENLILEQDLAAGSIIDENSEIAVVISALNSTRFVPEVLYLSYDEALPILEREGIPHSTLRVYTPTAPGIILWQNIPAGVQMEENITMNLLISDGLPTVDESKQTKVPDFTKMTYDEALAKASENGLYLATEAFKDHSLPLNYITEQDIKAGETLNQGSIIKVKRNTVTGTVTVPKLSGKDISVLKKELEDLYFDVTIEYSGSNTVPKGQVIDSYPTEGMTVDAGSEIVLIVSDGRPTYQMQEMEVPWWWFY